MRIGWLGLGKLGAPIVQVLKERHDVLAYDIDAQKTEVPNVAAACDGVDVVFVAVQTPHDPAYEGITRAPVTPQPFILSWLVNAVVQVSQVNSTVPIAIVSTVLPGDTRCEIIPRVPNPIVYNPAFVAMGSVEEDFSHPEFVLIGYDDNSAANTVAEVYWQLDIGPQVYMSIESAELTKVAYNTFISQKITFANTLMEICDKIPGANIDEVTFALCNADKRITSDLYLSGGMGDGGPCHPRDNIAMQYLAEQLNLSADPFSYVTRAREQQTEWLADKAVGYAAEWKLPLVLLGRQYKLGVDIEIGSAGLLLASLLDEIDVAYQWDDTSKPAVYVSCLPGLARDVPPGSVVIDPWGSTAYQNGVEIVTVGR